MIIEFAGFRSINVVIEFNCVDLSQFKTQFKLCLLNCVINDNEVFNRRFRFWKTQIHKITKEDEPLIGEMP